MSVGGDEGDEGGGTKYGGGHRILKLTAATLKASATLVAAWHELDTASSSSRNVRRDISVSSRTLDFSAAQPQDAQRGGNSQEQQPGGGVDSSVGLERLSELAEDVMVEYPYVSMADRSDVVDALKHAFREVRP